MNLKSQGFWWVTLATVLSIGVTAALGFWQLDRASQKESLHAQRTARETMPVLVWKDVRAALDQQQLDRVLDRRVAVQGHWVQGATVFLDNRQMNGRPGFFVLTPLQPEDGGSVLLVQRGWVARHFDDRSAVPVIDSPSGVVHLQGRLTPPPSKLYDFQGNDTGAIRQNIDLDAFGAELSLPLLPLSLLQSEAQDAADNTLLRDWPRIGADVHKHYGYAFQWFGLCTLIAILYVWFQFIAPRRRA